MSKKTINIIKKRRSLRIVIRKQVNNGDYNGGGSGGGEGCNPSYD